MQAVLLFFFGNMKIEFENGRALSRDDLFKCSDFFKPLQPQFIQVFYRKQVLRFKNSG